MKTIESIVDSHIGIPGSLAAGALAPRNDQSAAWIYLGDDVLCLIYEKLNSTDSTRISNACIGEILDFAN